MSLYTRDTKCPVYVLVPLTSPIVGGVSYNIKKVVKKKVVRIYM